MNFLSQALSESNGNPSTMRLLTLFVVIAVVGTWAEVSIQCKALQPLSYEQVLLVLGAMGAKVLQKGKELPETMKPTPNNSTTP